MPLIKKQAPPIPLQPPKQGTSWSVAPQQAPPPAPPDPTLGEAYVTARWTAPQQPWIKVTQPQDYAKVAQFVVAKKAAGHTPTGQQNKSKSMTPPGGNPLTTMVTVVRKGGHCNKNIENTICAQKAADIVMTVCMALEGLSASTPQVLSDHWSSSATVTGNFIFTFNSQVDFNVLRLYGKTIITPFCIGKLSPADGWVWTHLQGVLTLAGHSVLYDATTMKQEILRDLVM